jgi:MATE family multidrug resistance protein
LHPNPDYALGAMSIYQSINSFCFMFPMGFSTAGSSRVGFFLGRNQPNQARLASKLSIWSSGLASVVLGSILLFTPHTMIPSLFTSDENVLLQTSYTIPLLAFYVVAGM